MESQILTHLNCNPLNRLLRYRRHHIIAAALAPGGCASVTTTVTITRRNLSRHCRCRVIVLPVAVVRDASHPRLRHCPLIDDAGGIVHSDEVIGPDIDDAGGMVHSDEGIGPDTDDAGRMVHSDEGIGPDTDDAVLSLRLLVTRWSFLSYGSGSGCFLLSSRSAVGASFRRRDLHRDKRKRSGLRRGRELKLGVSALRGGVAIVSFEPTCVAWEHSSVLLRGLVRVRLCE